MTATANSIAGPYTVTATAAGGTPTIDFDLKNLIVLTFSGVTNQSITYGSSSATFSGILANGTRAPQGENLAVTFDGVTQQAVIGSTGAFSATFDTGGLHVAGSPYTVSYAYTSDGTFASAGTTSTLVVTKATPTITWANPADITYGTVISAKQLDAAAAWTVDGVNGAVAGSFTYTSAVGTLLGAGTGQTLSVTFTPTDTSDYNTASDSVTINVDKATPTIAWANPAGITYGTALSATQLDATSSWTVAGVNGAVAGMFTYTPAAGTVLRAGTGETLSVTFTPTDTTDYNIASHSVTINVAKATPDIAWTAPAGITYGTALSAAQLDATTSWTVAGADGAVAGTFNYTPAAGSVLKTGTGQNLSVSFTPTDTNDYNTISDSVTINVAKATPTIAWASPAGITYGTALSATQLDATSSWTVGGVQRKRRGNVHVHPGRGHGLGRRHGPDALGYVHAHGHDRLRAHLRLGHDQCRQGGAQHQLGQPRRHHVWHCALAHAARCDIVVDGGRSKRKCRGNVHVHTGRGHGPRRRRGTGALGNVHSDGRDRLLRDLRHGCDQRRGGGARPLSGPTLMTLLSARRSRRPSSTRRLPGRWAE